MIRMVEQFSKKEIVTRIGLLYVAGVVYGAVCGFLFAKGWYVALLVSVPIMFFITYFYINRWVDYADDHVSGIQGEIKVGAILAQLPKSDFWYTNDIVLEGSYGNIDHIVVGKTGVWLIETKHWTGDNVTVKDGILKKDGFIIDSKHFRSVNSRALTLKAYLAECGAPVDWVQSVFVFSTNAMSVQVPERFEHVHVVGFRELPTLITGGAGNKPLTSEQRRRIQSAIEKRPNC